MSILTYQYSSNQIIMAIAYSILGTHSFFTLIQKIRYIDQPKIAFLFIIMSSVLLSTLSVWTAHFLLTFALEVGNNLPLYLDIKLTILSLVVAIVFNSIGFSISFLGFMKRVSAEYVLEVTKLDKKTGEIELETDNVVIHPTTSNNRETKKINRLSPYVDYCEFFQNQKLNKRDWICILIGGIFIVPSTILTHVVGMMAIKFQGEVTMMVGHQIWLSLTGGVACFIINMAFFYKDSHLTRGVLTCLMSSAIYGMHFLSIYFTNFFDTNSQINLEGDKNLLNMTDCSKLLFVLGGLISYVFKEVSNHFLNNSHMIYKTVGNYVQKNSRKMTTLRNFVEIENVKIEEERNKQMELQNSSLKEIRENNVDFLTISKFKNDGKQVKTLYDQLGENMIKKVVEKFISKLLNDPGLAYIYSDIDLEELIINQRNFLIMMLGGPNTYEQESNIEESHMKFKLTNLKFEYYKFHLSKSFCDFGVNGQKLREIIDIVEAWKYKIIGR